MKRSYKSKLLPQTTDTELVPKSTRTRTSLDPRQNKLYPQRMHTLVDSYQTLPRTQQVVPNTAVFRILFIPKSTRTFTNLEIKEDTSYPSRTRTKIHSYKILPRTQGKSYPLAPNTNSYRTPGRDRRGCLLG